MRPERRRQSIWFGIVVVAAFFVGVTLAVAWLDTGWPDIPHPVDGDRAVCVACHPAGQLPASHDDRVGQDCRSCHSQADGAEASVRQGYPSQDESGPPAVMSTTGGHVLPGGSAAVSWSAGLGDS